MQKYNFDEMGPTSYKKEEEGIVGLLIKQNIVKTKQQAYYVLLGILLFCLLLILFLNWPESQENLPPEAYSDQILDE